jgi:geranylgeranylglycerol-phosphate geranylgeranyltransferase
LLIAAYLSLFRVCNALFAGLACAIGFIIANHPFNLEVCLYSFAFVFSVAFANAHNDCMDYKIDCINRPNRPLPSGKISLRVAAISAFLLYVLSIALVCRISSYALLFFSGVGLCSYIYNTFLKSKPFIGNLMVALLTSSPFILSNLPQLVFFSFILTLARELLKDIEDMEGDSALNLKTLPLVIGVKFSLALVFVCEALCLLALAFWKPFALFAIVPCLALSVYFAIKKKWRHSQIILKISMAAGLICYLAL